MLNYEKNFVSCRKDGRYVCTFAAQMARMRDMTPMLSFSDEMDEERFVLWKESVKDKLESLL